LSEERTAKDSSSLLNSAEGPEWVPLPQKGFTKKQTRVIFSFEQEALGLIEEKIAHARAGLFSRESLR